MNTNCRQKQSFKSLANGLIEPAVVSNYTQAKLLAGIIKIGGGYKPTSQNFGPNLKAIEDAISIASTNKSTGISIVTHLNIAKRVLTEEAAKLGIAK